MNLIAITLKIPDNEAYTALRALQRLGIAVARVQRSELYTEHGVPEGAFNPNKHVMITLSDVAPREGEIWVEERNAPIGGRRYVAWRLLDHENHPLARAALDSAAQKLLCNPAIEKALIAL